MKKLISILSLLDWVISGTLLISGMVLSNQWMTLAGALGLVISYVAPAKRLYRHLERRMSRKQESTSDDLILEDDAFFKEVLTDPGSVPQTAQSFLNKPSSYAGVFISPNKHNQMTPDSLNLYIASPSDRLY